MTQLRRYSKLNWDSTLNLPKTTLPLRSALNDADFRDEISVKLYEKYLGRSRTREEFTLIDGPPFSNGDLHVGHALNKLLKDTILRSKAQEGFKIKFRPSWDCHGLPIELKALQEQIKSDPIEIRSLCKKFALEAIQSQKRSMQKWGLLADYSRPLLTIDPDFESNELDVLAQMVDMNLIYSAKKPVYFSPSSQTALAEAELEYSDNHTSLTAFIKFKAQLSPFISSKIPRKTQDIYFIAWTTTPWTLPSNKALAVGNTIIYSLLHSSTTGEYFIIAKSRISSICASLNHSLDTIVSDFCRGSDLVTCQYESLHFSPNSTGHGPVLGADFVTDESGSGIVHLAPDYGTDDYLACRSVGLEPNSNDILDDQGNFNAHAPSFLNGMNIFTGASETILEYLKCSGNFLTSNYYTHRYPYDWRTKKPVIQRATRQWFASISSILPQLETALGAVNFIPQNGKDKMLAMLRGRTDWCISRQRHWGLPIPAIKSLSNSNEVILDSRVIRHVASKIKSDPNGSDIWWTRSLHELIPTELHDDYSSKYTKTFDTLDGWFDSGTVWTNHDTPKADLYLEGSDQYRGWFQSSFITSVAVNGTAPFKNVLTHGFVLDQQGQKMSKSIGNVIDPDDIVKEYGVDVLRLWAASVNFKSDVNIGPEIIKQVAENKRKIRNTFRFILGNMYGYKWNSSKSFRWIDHVMIKRTESFHNNCIRMFGLYDFPGIVQFLCNFCSQDLSAFYFEIVKDRLYTEPIDSPKRQAAQAVLIRILQVLHYATSPLMPFLSAEIRSHVQEKDLLDFVMMHYILTPMPESMNFNWIQKERSKLLEWFNSTGKSELKAKSTFQLDLTVKIPLDLWKYVNSKDVAEMFTVASVDLIPTNEPESSIVSIKLSDRHKCPRCWTFNSLKVDEICLHCIGQVPTADIFKRTSHQ